MRGKPVQQVVAVPGTIDPDQNLFPGSEAGRAGQLGERVTEHGDVILGGVAADVPGPEQDPQRFPGPGPAVIDEHAQRVEAVALASIFHPDRLVSLWRAETVVRV